MAFNKTLIILIIFLSCLILNTNAAAVTRTRTPEARVWSICKPTTNPPLCYKTILPQLLTAGRFNIYKALTVEILAAQQQVQKTSAFIDTLAAKSGNSKDMADSLRICQEQYKNILESIDESIKEVSRRNAVEARFKFAAVMSYHATCNDQFTNNSPIVNDAQGVYDLGGNCVDIMKAIVDRESRKRGGKPATPTSPSPADPCKGIIGLCLFH